MTILLISKYQDFATWRETFHTLLPGIELRHWPEVGDPADVEMILAWKGPEGALQGFPNLRLICSLGQGVDHLFRYDDLPVDVPMVRLVDDGMRRQMTAYVIAAVTRRLCRMAEYEAAREWHPLAAYDPAATTVGVLGLGALGRNVVETLAHLGFAVRGWSRNPAFIPGVECFNGSGSLAEMLGGCDMVCCLLALTSETRGILDARAFAAMKPGAYLINSGKVDAVLHIKASGSNPVLSDAWISSTEQDVYDGAQSRYGPGASLTPVHRLLDEGRRFAVIGKPCDIAAIRNLQRIDSRAKKQIPYCLSIFCGGTISLTMLNRMPVYFGAAPDDLDLFRYRGEGWPGATHMETKDGQSFDLTYDQSWSDPHVPWKYDLQFRCKICPDAIGELADVSCPDGWIMKDGKPLHEEAPGVNLMVARSLGGAELVRQAEAAGFLTLAPCSMAELDQMHSDHKPRKTGWPARMLGLRLAGQPAMRVRNFRKLAAVLAAGPMHSLASLFGTIRRARAGLNREAGFKADAG